MMNYISRKLSESSKDHFVITYYDAYRDSTLSPAEVIVYRQHLASCQSCQSWFDNTAQLENRLRIEASAPATLSPVAVGRVKDRTTGRIRRKTKMNDIGGVATSAVTVVAFSFLIGLFIWQLSRDQQNTILTPEQASPSQQYTPESQTSLDQLLVEAVRGGSVNEAERLLVSGASANALDEKNALFSNPILRTAVMNGNLDLIELLIQFGADVNAQDSNGNEILWRAVRGGNLKIVQILLDAGADVHAINSQGSAVLPIGVESGQAEIVSLLLEAGADPNSTMVYVLDAGKDPLNEPALNVAVAEGFIDIVNLLLEAGADIDGRTQPLPGDSCTNLAHALHIAAYFDRADIVELLLDHGAKIDVQDYQDITPLYVSAQRGSTRVARVLIERGADVNIAWIGGGTALDASTSEEISRMLRNSGAGE